MTTIKDVVALLAGAATMISPSASTKTPAITPQSCGEVNVFYTGLTPWHPLAIAQGWDPVRVDVGLRNETVNLINAGYNVLAVWAGPETPISTLENRIDSTGVKFDVAAIGFGMRGSIIRSIIERFEDLVEMYEHKLPKARKVFNHDPESTLWSVTHRVPLAEDCKAAGKPGKLLGYEEICDSRCNHQTLRPLSKSTHDEL